MSKPGDLGHQHAHVGVAPEDGAERVGDLAGRQRAGRDLVGEWLEEVEVASINDREVDRRSGKVLCSLESTEPAADDDHPVPLGVGGLLGDEVAGAHSSAERERVSLRSRLAERDLDGPLADSVVLSHELVHAAVPEQAVPFRVDVDAV